jgi:hypothetical protein
VLVRLLGDPDIAGSAFDHVGDEPRMRSELREAVRGLLERAPGRPHDKAIVREPLIALASFAALARSPVDRDQRSDIRLVLDPEAPTRLVKMLAQLWRACGLLGLDHASAWELVRRVGMDSIPKLRRAVLDLLAGAPTTMPTTDVAEAVGHPAQTTRRALEDLAAHRVVTRVAGGQGRADRWELAEPTQRLLARTVPVLSGGPDRSVPVSSGAGQTAPSPATSTEEQRSDDDKTGKVGSDVGAPPSACPVCGRESCTDTTACLRARHQPFRDAEETLGPLGAVTVEVAAPTGSGTTRTAAAARRTAGRGR